MSQYPHVPNQPDPVEPSEPQPEKKRRGRGGFWFAGGVATGTIIAIAFTAGDSGEPVAATEPKPAVTKTVEIEVPGEVPQDQVDALDEREKELADRKAKLDKRETALDEREAAVTETEETVAANTVTDGIWVVGTDIEPGTYRAADVGPDCYWAVLVSGTNGAEIVNNGIPGGGNPTVTVEEGHDFETQRCGEWTLQ